MEERIVGWSALKDDFATFLSRLEDGPMVIIRHTKAVAVMVSFDDYQKLKAKASVVVLAPPVEVEGKP